MSGRADMRDRSRQQTGDDGDRLLARRQYDAQVFLCLSEGGCCQLASGAEFFQTADDLAFGGLIAERLNQGDRFGGHGAFAATALTIIPARTGAPTGGGAFPPARARPTSADRGEGPYGPSGVITRSLAQFRHFGDALFDDVPFGVIGDFQPLPKEIIHAVAHGAGIEGAAFRAFGSFPAWVRLGGAVVLGEN